MSLPIPPVGPTPAEAEAKMLALLKAKFDEGLAAVVHGGVDVGGGQKLNALFAAEDYPAILAFLKTGTAAKPPFVGMKLVVPKDPDASGFFKQITVGVMLNRFDAAEIAVVRDWINSL